jgi:hypothetical protein
MAFLRRATVRALSLRRLFFSSDQASSLGLKSGKYGGRYVAQLTNTHTLEIDSSAHCCQVK